MDLIREKFQSLTNMAKVDGVELELLVERGQSLNLATNAGKVERFDSSDSHIGGLRVILDGVEGYSYTESLELEDLKSAYHAALENAKFVTRGLSQGAGTSSPKAELWNKEENGNATIEEDKSLFNNSLETISLDEKINRAKQLEVAAKEYDSRIANVPYNSYREVSKETIIFNSRGVHARQRRTGVTAYAYCLARSGEGDKAESRMAGEGVYTRDARNLNIKEIAEKAAKKSIDKLGAVMPATGRYPVVIDREVVADFFGVFSDYFSAKSLDEKTTIYAKSPNAKENLGQKVGSPLLQIEDDPGFKDGVGNSPFDMEGAPKKKTVIVEGGKLKNFLTNSYYAKKLDLPHTASALRSAKSQLDIGISNLVIRGGTESLEDLLASYPKVIYVTDFTGYHSGFQKGSGAFSFQSEGELWENGKRVGPLCNFVVSGSVDELLGSIEKLSSRRSPTKEQVIAPDILISSLSVAGK